MNYANIKYNDISNGEGVRTSLFVSGCNHGCKGCFNREAWDFEYGNIFDEKVLEDIINSIKSPYISGLSLLGGEPLNPKNQYGVYKIIKEFRKEFADTKNIWCYTGYTYKDDFIRGNTAYTEYIEYILENIDVLVDGKFIEELKDVSLVFRGSSNQRIIDLKNTRVNNEPVLYYK